MSAMHIRTTSYNLATWSFALALPIIPQDGRRTWVPNGSRHYPRHMTNEERIHEVEDAVILLTNILEEKMRAFRQGRKPKRLGLRSTDSPVDGVGQNASGK